MSVPQLRQAATGTRPRLLDEVRAVMRRKHYSIRTERTYIDWIKRFIFFHNKRHPLEMDALAGQPGASKTAGPPSCSTDRKGSATTAGAT